MSVPKNKSWNTMMQVGLDALKHHDRELNYYKHQIMR